MLKYVFFFSYAEALLLSSYPAMPAYIHKLSASTEIHTFFSKKSLILEFEKYEIDKVGNFSHLEEFLPLYLTLFLAQLKRD